MAEFFIPGPAGHIQAMLDDAHTPGENISNTKAQHICAILCHPHPQYGGSMLDGVLQTAVDVLLQHGIDTLRFNFRGVGQSAGMFDQGRGETEDLLAVHDYVQKERAPHATWWFGYSFGAAMIWQALQHSAPQRALLIAPPVGMMAFNPVAKDVPPVAAVAGDADSYVNIEALQALANTDVHIIPGADHFFSGCHDKLTQTIEQLFLNR